MFIVQRAGEYNGIGGCLLYTSPRASSPPFGSPRHIDSLLKDLKPKGIEFAKIRSLIDEMCIRDSRGPGQQRHDAGYRNGDWSNRQRSGVPS